MESPPTVELSMPMIEATITSAHVPMTAAKRRSMLFCGVGPGMSIVSESVVHWRAAIYVSPGAQQRSVDGQRSVEIVELVELSKLSKLSKTILL